MRAAATGRRGQAMLPGFGEVEALASEPVAAPAHSPTADLVQAAVELGGEVVEPQVTAVMVQAHRPPRPTQNCWWHFDIGRPDNPKNIPSRWVWNGTAWVCAVCHPGVGIAQ